MNTIARWTIILGILSGNGGAAPSYGSYVIFRDARTDAFCRLALRRIGASGKKEGLVGRVLEMANKKAVGAAQVSNSALGDDVLAEGNFADPNGYFSVPLVSAETQVFVQKEGYSPVMFNVARGLFCVEVRLGEGPHLRP
jgi:hypothetical protein